MDEKVQFALELLTRTQGNPIWFREQKIKQNRECNALIVYETFTQRPCGKSAMLGAMEDCKRRVEGRPEPLLWVQHCSKYSGERGRSHSHRACIPYINGKSHLVNSMQRIMRNE